MQKLGYVVTGVRYEWTVTKLQYIVISGNIRYTEYM